MHAHFVTFHPLWILDFFFQFSCSPSQLWQNIYSEFCRWVNLVPPRKTTIMIWVFSSSVDSALCEIDLCPVFFCHAYTISHRRQPIKEPDQILDRFMSSLWNFGEPKGRCLSLSNREWLVLTLIFSWLHCFSLYRSVTIKNTCVSFLILPDMDVFTGCF